MLRWRKVVLLACALLIVNACNKPNTSDQNAPQSTASTSSGPMADSSGAQASAPPAVEAPETPPPVVPAGTSLTVKLGQALGSKSSQAGQSFSATLANSISVGGNPVIPAGSSVEGTVVDAKAKGKVSGEGELSLKLTSVTVKGTPYSISTNTWQQVAKGKGKRTAATTGGGAAAGALIGGIAGGGKGAAIGAGVGAGAGFAGGTLTGNQQIELPAESSVTFKLSAPLTLKERQGRLKDSAR